MSLLDGERTFFEGDGEERLVEGFEVDADWEEREESACCLSNLPRLVSSGWSARLVDADGDDGAFTSLSF